jgi:hypothetical protein
LPWTWAERQYRLPSPETENRIDKRALDNDEDDLPSEDKEEIEDVLGNLARWHNVFWASGGHAARQGRKRKPQQLSAGGRDAECLSTAASMPS